MKRLGIVVLGMLLAGTGVVLPAQAAFRHDVVVSANPANWVPRVEDGKVRATTTVDGVTVAGGDFTSVTQLAGTDTRLPRQDIFAFNAAGEISQDFVPRLSGAGADVFDVIPAGDGSSVFVAGIFGSVNGVKRTGRLVKIDVHTGAVDPTFRAPVFDGRVNALHLVNGRLYVAGAFTTVGGVPRTSLVALDPATGVDTGTVNFSFSQTFNGGNVGINTFTMNPDGSRLVAIGNFRLVNGQSRPQVVMIDTSGPTATLSSWATQLYSPLCGGRFETYATDVDSSPDGSYFVIVATGGFGGGAPKLCDSAARWEFARTGPNQEQTWVEYSGGDTFTAVGISGTAIYVGGHYRWLNNPFVGDMAGPGSLIRRGLAALDPRNGLPFSWNPGRNLGYGVWGFEVDAQGLWIGHDRNTVAGENRGRLVLMPLEGGSILPGDNTGSLPGDVYLLDKDQGVSGADEVIRHNDFTGDTVTGVETVDNGVVDWDSVRGSFMVDGVLYTGLADGTLTKRTYDGTAFGASQVVDLRGLTDFSNELKDARAMFFDQVNGRVYYTSGSSTSLYYRYFTPESGIVGAIRHTAMGSGPGFAWARTSGAFLAGGKLYYRTDDTTSTATLRSATWNGTVPVAGTSTVVPPQVGVDWSSRAMFLYAADE